MLRQRFCWLDFLSNYYQIKRYKWYVKFFDLSIFTIMNKINDNLIAIQLFTCTLVTIAWNPSPTLKLFSFTSLDLYLMKCNIFAVKIELNTQLHMCMVVWVWCPLTHLRISDKFRNQSMAFFVAIIMLNEEIEPIIWYWN